MFYNQNNRLNPNPITKFIAVILLGMGVAHSVLYKWTYKGRDKEHPCIWSFVFCAKFQCACYISTCIEDTSFPGFCMQDVLSSVFRREIYDKNLRCGKYHFVHGCS